jgi:hypothetical protein
MVNDALKLRWEITIINGLKAQLDKKMSRDYLQIKFTIVFLSE